MKTYQWIIIDKNNVRGGTVHFKDAEFVINFFLLKRNICKNFIVVYQEYKIIDLSLLNEEHSSIYNLRQTFKD